MNGGARDWPGSTPKLEGLVQCLSRRWLFKEVDKEEEAQTRAASEAGEGRASFYVALFIQRAPYFESPITIPGGEIFWREKGYPSGDYVSIRDSSMNLFFMKETVQIVSNINNSNNCIIVSNPQ